MRSVRALDVPAGGLPRLARSRSCVPPFGLTWSRESLPPISRNSRDWRWYSRARRADLRICRGSAREPLRRGRGVHQAGFGKAHVLAAWSRGTVNTTSCRTPGSGRYSSSSSRRMLVSYRPGRLARILRTEFPQRESPNRAVGQGLNENGRTYGWPRGAGVYPGEPPGLSGRGTRVEMAFRARR